MKIFLPPILVAVITAFGIYRMLFRDENKSFVFFFASFFVLLFSGLTFGFTSCALTCSTSEQMRTLEVAKTEIAGVIFDPENSPNTIVPVVDAQFLKGVPNGKSLFKVQRDLNYWGEQLNIRYIYNPLDKPENP